MKPSTILGLAGLSVMTACLFVDCGKGTWTPIEHGRVVSKTYLPPYNTTTIDSDGHLTITWHDEEYDLFIQAQTFSSSKVVNREYFMSVVEGQEILVRARHGKYTGIQYFVEILPNAEN